MDPQDLKEWCDFCEARVPYESGAFSQIFMGMFAEPLTDTNKAYLHKVFSYIPNSSKALENLLRIGIRTENKDSRQIIDLVLRDLKAMRKIVDNSTILSAIDLGVSEIVVDRMHFLHVSESAFNKEYIQYIADYFTNEIYRQSDCEKIAALSDAFYGIANSQHLQYALTANLLCSSINCDNYFELYKLGVDYAMNNNGALVVNYRQ